MKSKLDRCETVLKEIQTIFKEIKAERLENLKLIDEFSEFASIKTGKIPKLKILLLKLENCSNWEEIKILIPIFKEIRFIGSPKRTEISQLLLKKFEEIYEKSPEDEILIKFLYEFLKFDQLNPLIIPKEVPEDSSEIYKTIVYTAKDLLLNSNQ